MTKAEFEQVVEFAQKRDEKVYAWLRYLIGLGSGSLAVLVSMQSHMQPGSAGIAQKIAWVSIGSGILLGSLRLYGEVWIARELVRKFVAQKTKPPSADGPISVEMPKTLKWCERACYFSFCVAVVALVACALLAVPAKS